VDRAELLTPSASMVSLHRRKIAALEQLLSVIIRTELYLLNSGILTIKSITIL
jgi:hypothetical protein